MWDLIEKIKRDEYGRRLLLHCRNNCLDSVETIGLDLFEGRDTMNWALERFFLVQFDEVFSDFEIVVSVIRQLSWTHILALIPLKKPLQREFYAEMCRAACNASLFGNPISSSSRIQT